LEKKILTQVDCEFVIKMHFAFQNEKNLYLVLEYCPGGEFFRYLNKTGILSEKNCKFYAAQLVLGIEYLHS
jgi:serine/threonine protein kinase